MTVNPAPAVHRYTVDIAVPAGVDPDGALDRALAGMSAEAGCPNRVHAHKQPSGLVVTDIDAATDLQDATWKCSLCGKHFAGTDVYPATDDLPARTAGYCDNSDRDEMYHELTPVRPGVLHEPRPAPVNR